MSQAPQLDKVSMKSLKAEDPRWCTGCGDYSILVNLRKFMVNYQIQAESTVNISGIGCSGRIPHYMNTYGLHSIHGRAVPIALGVTMANPNLKLFVHSGDGDSLSIGGNHLMHGIHKNFNLVYLLFDNQIYGLTKNQTSPTSRKGLKTQTQPGGYELEPLNPVKFALGLGASFVASTADWLAGHMVDTLEAAYNHKGFSFVHIAQRCPKFNPAAWDFKNSSWMTFLSHEKGVKADLKMAKDATQIDHDPSDLKQAFEHAEHVPNRFGLFYRQEKVTYDDILRKKVEDAEQQDPKKLLDGYKL